MNKNLTCIITGKKYTFSKDYYNKKVEEYLDEESLQKFFITKKAKVYLNKGYSIAEIRNILNIDATDLPDSDSADIKELIEYHRIRGVGKNKKIANTLNFATHKSDSQVARFINNIKNYE